MLSSLNKSYVSLWHDKSCFLNVQFSFSCESCWHHSTIKGCCYPLGLRGLSVSSHPRLVSFLAMWTPTWCMRSTTTPSLLADKPSSTSLHVSQSAAATPERRHAASLWCAKTHTQIKSWSQARQRLLTCSLDLQPSVADLLSLAWWTSSVAWWDFFSVSLSKPEGQVYWTLPVNSVVPTYYCFCI